MKVKFKKKLLILMTLLAGAGFLFAFFPLRSYLLRPQILYYYLTRPPMRDLMNLIAEERLWAFPAVWDTSEGVFLSKKMFRPVEMKGRRSYGYLPGLKKIGFQTGTPEFQRKFEAVDTPRLRKILGKLTTQYLNESTFDARGFRNNQYSYEPGCPSTAFFAGDSFTEGLWVNDEQTFVNLYAEALNRNSKEKICAVNAGVNGYGIDEESFAAMRDFPLFRFQTLFVIVYPNDIASDAFGVLTESVTDLENKWQNYLETLKELAGFSKTNHIRLIVLPIPPKEQFAMPESRRVYQEKIETFCIAEGIEFWDPYETLSRYVWEDIYFDWDPHFNPSGHRILAEFLREKTLTSRGAKL